jgi:transcriptional regulator of acetoin/glycerol metabolism
MFEYTEEYRQQLIVAWERFCADEDFDYSFIRPVIYDSWLRSKQYGVATGEAKTILLNMDDLEYRRQKNSDLISIVKPFMDNLYKIVEGSGFYLMLVDADGIILDETGDKEIITESRKYSHLEIGANRTEAFAGTNAIGTCLATGQPIQVWGEEHYMTPHKKYACSAGPIKNHEGKIIGCLNITGLARNVHTHTLGMVLCAVDGITKEFIIRQTYSEIEFKTAQTNLILDSILSGFIMLDKKDRIININNRALQMLRLKDNVLGKNIKDLVSIGDARRNEPPFAEMQNNISNVEINFYRKETGLQPLKFNLSVNIDHLRGERVAIIKLDEPKQIHSLVRKVGGFTAKYTFADIIGSSDALAQTIKLSKRAANSDANVLILGESGTGKELIAQSMHNSGRHSSGPFVVINCGALPKGLVESELFGYEGGAFTGANKSGQPGKFELADGGTIFLDEIGEMSLDIQASLLRVIQTKEIVRIGGKYPKQINVRIIAATNRDLYQEVRNHNFREDLYYRLNVITIKLPSLRERRKDIVDLARFFISCGGGRNFHFNLADDVLPVLMNYSWPGNVRELENMMERAMNLSDGEYISLEHLPDNILAAAGDTKRPALLETSEQFNLDEVDHTLIMNSLNKTHGNVKKAAELLGISRRTLYRKMDLYCIPCSSYREARRV